MINTNIIRISLLNLQEEIIKTEETIERGRKAEESLKVLLEQEKTLLDKVAEINKKASTCLNK